MQVILKAVSHPELGEIIVKDSLFAIGRHEEPFSSYDPQFVEKLSRRHARIFEQDGIVYIADLGSLNGTTVNGVSVDSLPVRLQRDDKICFTGKLCYQIEILGAAAKSPPEEKTTSPVQLVLVPEKNQEVLEPIVVTKFPFLVNKASDVFSRYKSSLAEEVSYISRRHAHIFLKGRDLYIEDLGSTNGTYVSDVRLEEHVRELKEGDILAFGGDAFVYRVELLYLNEVEEESIRENSALLTGTAHAKDDVTRTTFVTSANSFLDIFCVEDELASGGRGKLDGTDAGSGMPTDEEAGQAKGLNGPFPRLRSIMREMRGNESEGGSRRSGRIWLIALSLICVIGLGIYLFGAPKREIRELLEQTKYTEALVQANRYLNGRQDDREVNELATEAMLKALVPSWLNSVGAVRFDEAEQVVERGKRLSGTNPDRQKLLDTLLWITRLEQFFRERGGSDTPVVMFEHEGRIKELAEWWDAEPKAHYRSLGIITQHVPEFAAWRARVFSYVRSLHSEQSLSVAAIERLLDELERALQESDTKLLQSILSDFQETYPRIQGVSKLRTDLDNYIPIDTAVKEKKWITAHRLASETDFQTELFQEWIGYLLGSELPSAEIIGRYRQASSDWQAGRIGEAMAELEMLKAERWGELAERSLQRNKQILVEYKQLEATKGQAEYDNLLLAFYRMLDPEEDAHFAKSVAEAVRVHSGRALAEANDSFSEARLAWEKYRQGGGIRGLHRLEAGVSSTYRRMATLLSESYSRISQGIEIYNLLDKPYAAEWDELYSQIVNEVRLQRRSLSELAMVLEPDLKQAKLDLLPILSADESESMSDAQVR